MIGLNKGYKGEIRRTVGKKSRKMTKMEVKEAIWQDKG